jgi:hypothetical protein
MGCRALTYANFARLNDEDIPVLCSRKEAREWYQSKAADLHCLRQTQIAGWQIFTTFNWFSLATDGPPLFWKVTCSRASGPFERRELWLGTKEAALELHELCAAVIARGHTLNGLIPLDSTTLAIRGLPEPDEADWWKE